MEVHSGPLFGRQERTRHALRPRLSWSNRCLGMKKMSKRIEDPLVAETLYELMPGRLVRWDEVSRLVHNLDRVQEKVAGLVKAGEAQRAVRLYEIFLSGVYAKIEEADDECDLANLFHRLACGWIQARQAAGCPAEETVSQLFNWIKNDDYGEALEHFEKARDLYCGASRASEWEALVGVVRSSHSRKSGFLSAFGQVVSGKSQPSSSFADEAQERWKRLTS
jgi:hypothetical protein